MTRPLATLVAAAFAVAAAMGTISSATTSAQAPLTLNTSLVTIKGTSNIHDYTASTTTVRVTKAQLGDAGAAANWSMPSGIAAFDVAIPAASLTSPKEGVDKNMHKALKVGEFADITFRLSQFDIKDDGTGQAIGMLTIAGVERKVTLAVQSKRTGGALAVHAQVSLLMTDYGVTPPKAMMGMLKTDPKVTVTIDTVVAHPLT